MPGPAAAPAASGPRSTGQGAIAQGAHPKYIQVQLGHASIQTTLDRYGHLMPDVHAAGARKLDRLVFGPEPTAGVTEAASSSDDGPATRRA